MRKKQQLVEMTKGKAVVGGGNATAASSASGSKVAKRDRADSALASDASM